MQANSQTPLLERPDCTNGCWNFPRLRLAEESVFTGENLLKHPNHTDSLARAYTLNMENMQQPFVHCSRGGSFVHVFRNKQCSSNGWLKHLSSVGKLS